MRRHLQPMLLLLAVSLAGCGGAAPGPMVGTWEADDREMTFVFEADGQVQLRVGGRDPFIKQGTYQVDLNQDPAHLDLIFSDREINTIFELTDEGLSMENIVYAGERPTEFGQDRIDFTRVE